MKKLLTVLLATTAITLSSTITYAADTPTNVSLDSSTVSSTFVKDTPTKISLDDSVSLSVELKSNLLVFNSISTRETYDSIIITLMDTNKDKVVETYNYKKGEVNGATIDLADLSDGSYELRTLKSAKGVGNRPLMYAFTVEVKGGVGTFKPRFRYSSDLKDTATERTDAVAIDYYADSANQASIKQANLITAGITNDYDKAKAIYGWVASHMTYSANGSTTELYPGSGISDHGQCGVFAAATYALFEGAGLPAKYIVGYEHGDAHAWNEVYVDGRWVFVDSTFVRFDMPIASWSVAYDSADSITNEDAKVWDGTVYFIDPKQNKVLQEIKNIPAGSLLTETYGYNAADLYSDPQFTKLWNFTTDKISSHGAKVFVKTYGFTVKFDSQDGTSVDSETVTPEANGYGKVTEPATPTKDGYTFVGWVVDNPYNSKVWDFNTNVIQYDRTMYAKWQQN
ncbi:transglutaminase domain-containing protein [Clostridium sp.]|uniref:transglutaminase domain-containing protein n=1 Tax=Clostridium sp. TaxID=1506 RepID=UPI00284A287E|nr:transglutaminase domain-containing protein [Clostridium sp.]MDR3597088.1 transglutaminase domain-containing protein [Clostridium sp.]